MVKISRRLCHLTSRAYGARLAREDGATLLFQCCADKVRSRAAAFPVFHGRRRQWLAAEEENAVEIEEAWAGDGGSRCGRRWRRQG